MRKTRTNSSLVPSKRARLPSLSAGITGHMAGCSLGEGLRAGRPRHMLHAASSPPAFARLEFAVAKPQIQSRQRAAPAEGGCLA